MFSFKLKVIIAFAAIYLVWGSTFFFVKVALHSFSPFILSSLRFFIGGLSVMTFAVLKKNQFPKSNELIKQALLGCIIFMGGIMAVVWAQQYLSSSLASTIITTPFWFIILDKKQWSYYFTNRNIIVGLFLGLSGVILLMLFKQSSTANSTASMQLLSMIVMVLGSFLWVSGSLYLKYNPSPSSVFANTSIQLLAAGICSTMISLFNGEIANFHLAETRLIDWLSIFYLAIFSTTLTFLAFIWLIKIKPPAIVSTYSYINPMIATLLGWSLGSEHISLIQILALFIILSGVLFVNLGKNKI
jgi:drug/metabolite transporter (DMT)-like permease